MDPFGFTWCQHDALQLLVPISVPNNFIRPPVLNKQEITKPVIHCYLLGNNKILMFLQPNLRQRTYLSKSALKNATVSESTLRFHVCRLRKMKNSK